MLRILVVLLACWISSATTALAQAPEGRPFDATTLELSFLRPVNEGNLDESWSLGPGPELNLETPFYWGRAQFGIHGADNEGVQASAPDYLSVFTYVGRGAEARVAGPVLALGGVRTGFLWMQFDDDGNQAGGSDESELGFEFLGRLRVPLASAVHVSGAARYRLVLTRPELKHVYLSLGLSVTLTNPDWLRRFFD